MRGHVKVELDAVGRGTLSLDDAPLRGVRAATIQSTAGELTTVTLTLAIETVQYAGEAVVVIGDSAAETLRALGWTPPADETSPGFYPTTPGRMASDGSWD